MMFGLSIGEIIVDIETRVVRVLGIRKVVKYGNSARGDVSLVKTVVETYGRE